MIPESDIKKNLERTRDGSAFWQFEEISELMQQYIFEKRGVSVKISPPQTTMQFMLFNGMSEFALRYFYEKFKPKIRKPKSKIRSS